MITTAQVRQQFLDYYSAKNHTVVSSSSLVPNNDPTLLFVNAGMVQFKDVFLGQEKRAYTRATTSQRCVRAGGKHNDLENVGYTARHHTFFEMLGNFSFGDYFKEQAIKDAWEFLTVTLKLPEEKLWVTVFEEDSEAEEIWLKDVGVSSERFSRIGAKDNFWQMGDTGPCGPCTEIFYDHGEHVWGGPPGTPEEDGDRYIEIWNLVFMQYDRSADGTLTPLPKPSVDTGMGLERLTAVLQNVHSNYEIDLFDHLLTAAAKVVGVKNENQSSLRVIADHIRSCSFLIVDGVLPSNEGRGYVLRRIIRRAIRHGHKLACKKAFFSQLVAALVTEMGEAYPELVKNQAHVEKVLKQEEERFAQTLDQGMSLLNTAIEPLKKGDVIDGEVVFKLYDTYGFPADLTADVARENELSIDEDGFEKHMNAQRERARAGSNFGADLSARVKIDEATQFEGYEHLDFAGKVSKILDGNAEVDSLESGQSAVLVLDTTPFYAESGGQAGDRGLIKTSSGATFKVTDTQKFGAAIGHIGELQSGSIKLADAVESQVDAELRLATIRNHSATHIMHAVLRDVLGDHVQQKGSHVDENRLRFDFAHFEPITDEQIAAIEAAVNAEVIKNTSTQADVTTMEKAIEKGALAFFGDKYGDEVRVLSIGTNSVELCGGTHVDQSGDIGLFKIIQETGVASGVRRIEAITGEAAYEWLQALTQSANEASRLLKEPASNIGSGVASVLDKTKALEKEIAQLKAKLANQMSGDLVNQAVEVNGIKVLAARMDGLDGKALRTAVEDLRNQLKVAAVVLGSADGDKVSLVAGVSKAETSRIKAGDLVNSVAQQVGGKGGGRPDMAQAGGTNPAALDDALASVQDWFKENVK